MKLVLGVGAVAAAQEPVGADDHARDGDATDFGARELVHNASTMRSVCHVFMGLLRPPSVALLWRALLEGGGTISQNRVTARTRSPARRSACRGRRPAAIPCRRMISKEVQSTRLSSRLAGGEERGDGGGVGLLIDPQHGEHQDGDREEPAGNRDPVSGAGRALPSRSGRSCS